MLQRGARPFRAAAAPRRHADLHSLMTFDGHGN